MTLSSLWVCIGVLTMIRAGLSRAMRSSATVRSSLKVASKAVSGRSFSVVGSGQLNGRMPAVSRSFQLSMSRSLSAFKDSLDGAASERALEGVVPKPLDAEETANLCEMLKNPPAGEEQFLLDHLSNRIPPGVDEAAYVKASFLSSVAKGEVSSPILDAKEATRLLGTMQGGYNIHTLIELLDDAALGGIAADGLSQTLLMFDSFYDVEAKAKAGNKNAEAVMKSWQKLNGLHQSLKFPRRLL